MKNLKLFMLILISSTIFTVYSCTEDDQVLVSSSELAFYPEQDSEGRLLFDDMSHFQSFMQEYEDVSLERLQEINMSQSFNSSYLLRVAKEQDQGFQFTSEIIEDKKFASILSQSNEIAFKDGMVYQANHDFCFWVSGEHYSLINDFRSSSSLNFEFDEEGMSTYKENLTVLKTIQESSRPESIAVPGQAQSRGSEDEEFNTDPRSKLEGCTHRRNYGIYQNIFAETEGEIRNGPFWNRWRGLTLQNVSVSSNNATLLFGSQNIPVAVPFNVNRTNAQNAKFRLYWAVGIGVSGTIGGSFNPAPLGGFPQVLQGSSATHSGRHQGQTITFNTQW